MPDLNAVAQALVAEGDPQEEQKTGGAGAGPSVVGYALYFSTYGSFATRPCLHLEDLYVTPHARGEGHGRALLAAVAAEARRRECPRLDWCVLDWNEPAIEFYRRIGADLLADWRVCRLEGDALARVADLADKIR